MVPDWLIIYVGGGILIIIGYVIVSNTLWLFLGSKALQILPGVGGEYTISTFKIASMLVMSIIGVAIWPIRLLFALTGFSQKITLKDSIALSLQHAGRIQQKILEKKSTDVK